MLKYTAWIGRDNTIDFILQSGAPLKTLLSTDMILITKYGFTYKGLEYNSDTHPAQCDKSDEDAVIKFRPGLITEISPGVPSDLTTPGHDAACELLIYSQVNPQGLVWGPQFKLTMKQD